MFKPLTWALALVALLAIPACPVIAAIEPAAPHATVTTATPTGTAVAAPAHGEGEHKAGLMPDLSTPAPWFSAMWALIIFAIVIAILYPTAWKNVLAGLKAREQRIRQDIADAEAARQKADATLKEYSAKLTAAADEARATVAAASAEAERVAATIRARGETEATEAKNRAIREIDAARKQALSEIYEQAAELATSVAEKIIRRSLTADDQRDLVARSLEELQSVGRG